MTEPALRWAGSKRQLLPALREMAPSTFGRYFEPFMGSGAFFFDRMPQVAILGDANVILMETYRAIQSDLDRVITRLRYLEGKYRADPEAFYYKQRTIFPIVEKNAIARENRHLVAAWCIFINKTCFNGLWRVSRRKGTFNTPWCQDPRRGICDETNLQACAYAIRGAELLNGDFEATTARAREGDFCYFDCPYWPSSPTADFTSYTKDGFSSEDQVRLRDVALRLKDRGVRVLLSHPNVAPIWDLYEEAFELFSVKARRAINSVGGSRGHVEELLIRG